MITSFITLSIICWEPTHRPPFRVRVPSRHNQSSLSYCFSLRSLNHRSYLINWVRWTPMRMDHAHLWNFRISDINEMLNWASNDVINQQQISYRSWDTFLRKSMAQDGEKQMCWPISTVELVMCSLHQNKSMPGSLSVTHPWRNWYAVAWWHLNNGQ